MAATEPLKIALAIKRSCPAAEKADTETGTSCMFWPTRSQKVVIDCTTAARVVVTRPAAAETTGSVVA